MKISCLLQLTFSEDHDSGEILEARAVFEQNESHSPGPLVVSFTKIRPLLTRGRS
jgi:hypothetical protein